MPETLPTPEQKELVRRIEWAKGLLAMNRTDRRKRGITLGRRELEQWLHEQEGRLRAHADPPT